MHWSIPFWPGCGDVLTIMKAEVITQTGIDAMEWAICAVDSERFSSRRYLRVAG
ncbi:hypothetical protein RMR21_016255 [Agrobacterium sp. rho-8.1]|nr:hypothetical protein [Agrobacterium sp. rho-8.1]